MVELLIAKGANVNNQNESGNVENSLLFELI